MKIIKTLAIGCGAIVVLFIVFVAYENSSFHAWEQVNDAKRKYEPVARAIYNDYREELLEMLEVFPHNSQSSFTVSTKPNESTGKREVIIKSFHDSADKDELPPETRILSDDQKDMIIEMIRVNNESGSFLFADQFIQFRINGAFLVVSALYYIPDKEEIEYEYYDYICEIGEGWYFMIKNYPKI